MSEHITKPPWLNVEWHATPTRLTDLSVDIQLYKGQWEESVHNEIEFLKPVYPKEKVSVISEKVYFRFGKLKCKVRMINKLGIEVCSGTIAGMIV